MAGKGNLTTGGEYEKKTLEEGRRLLQRPHSEPIPAAPTINQGHLHHGQQQRHTNGRRGAGPKTKPHKKKPRFDPTYCPRRHGRKSKNDTTTEDPTSTPNSQETGLNLVPRFKISKKGAPGSGRLLHTIYDSSRRETLIAESVVKKLRLPVFPWKPGNPIEVRSNKGLWLEITAYVTVHAEVPGLSDADLGQCNFGIMPDNIQGLEGVEIAVGARALEKLEEDCGLSPETRADIDLNYKGQKVLPMNSVLETGQPPAMFLGHGGHQQPSSLLQPPVYNPSFGFSNTSAFASGFSSNPASTPRTSLCESVRAQTTMYDCLNPLPPAIDQDNEEDWGNKSMISGGLQYGHHDNDNRSSISQAYSFSEQSLPGFNTQDTPGRPATTVSTTFGRRTPQVPSLTISPVMSFHGQRRYSVNGGYIQPEFSPTHSLMSHVSAATTGANFGPRLRPTNLGHLRSLSESQAEFGGLETTSSHWQLHMEDDLLGMDPNDIGMPVDPSIEPMDPDPFGPGFS